MTRTTSVAIIAVSLLAIAGVAAGQTTFTPLGNLGGTDVYSEAWAVSRDGAVVVGGSPSRPSNPQDAAFLWVGGTLAELAPGGNDLPGGSILSRALGISANGSIAVGLSAYNGVRTHAFKFGPGDAALVDLVNISPQTPELTAANDISAAEAISDDGAVIVGRGFRQATSNSEACFWLNGAPGATGIGDLTGGIARSDAHGVSGNGLVIVGEANSASGREAFSWTQAGGMVGLGDATGGGFDSTAYAASTDGNVIVGYGTTASGVEATRWLGGLPRTLGDLPGGDISSTAFAVSGNGTVVVGSGDAGRPDPTFPIFNTPEAIIWDVRHGMRRLADEFGAAVPAGWIPISANGVTITATATVVVGSGYNSSNDIEAYVATLPRFCPADVNDSGTVTVQDIFDFLTAYFASSALADVNGSGAVTLQDIFDFLAFYFGGC